MARTILIIILAVLPCIAFTQEQDVLGTYVGQQLGVRGGETVTLNLMPGGKATVAVAQAPGARPLVSRGTWRFEGSGFVRVDIAGMAGSGTLYFHRYENRLVATQDPFKLGGFPLQLSKLEPASGKYLATRTGAGGLQRLVIQLNKDQTASLVLQQEEQTTNWRGNWEVLASGDVQVTLDMNGRREKMTLVREGAMLRASEWDRRVWGSAAMVFVRG